jgi:toxin secretion/phage lysis holin
MENIITAIKIACGAVAAVLSNIFGGFDVLFVALLWCILIDYITGLCAAIYRRKLNSEVGFKGILKKFVILCIVAFAHELAIVVNVPELRDLVVGFYIANEGISILENAGKMNIPVARALADFMEQLKEKTNKDDEGDK